MLTERGDIKVVIAQEDGDAEERSVWTDKDVDSLEEEQGKKVGENKKNVPQIEVASNENDP